MQTKYIVLIAVAVFLFFTFLSSCTITGEGERRVILSLSKATGETHDAGRWFVLPWGLGSTETYNIREQTIDLADPSSGTKDMQTIAVSIRVNYRLLDVVKVHKRFRQNYQEIALEKAMPEAIKAVTAQYRVEDLIQKREEASTAMGAYFERVIEASYPGMFQIVTFSIMDLQPSRAFTIAVEAKQIAEQEAMRTRNQIEQSKAQAERDEAEAIGSALATKARAEGSARAMVLEAEARAEAIRLVGTALKEYPEMLTMRGLERWDGELPKVVGEVGVILDKVINED